MIEMGRSLEAGVGPSKRNFAVCKSKPRETLRVARKHAALQPPLTQAKPRFLNRTNRQRQTFVALFAHGSQEVIQLHRSPNFASRLRNLPLIEIIGTRDLAGQIGTLPDPLPEGAHCFQGITHGRGGLRDDFGFIINNVLLTPLWLCSKPLEGCRLGVA